MPSAKKYSFIIQPPQAALRIDKFLALKFPHYSRAFFQKLIKQARVQVNDRVVKASYLLEPGDRVEVEIPPPEETELIPEPIPLDILYEDAHLLVINKPAGMVVHPGAGVRRGTLVNALMAHCTDLSGVGGRLRPGIVHRLDKNTSGLLVVAKNDAAHTALQQQFAEKSAVREYKALVWGRPEPSEGRLETFLNRSKSDPTRFVVADRGKPAVTLYRVERQFAFLALVNVQLKTGRTHQIRAHFNYLHHPVFGDPEYAGRQKQVKRLSALSERKFALYLLQLINRQALHAYRLGFEHPVEKRWMEFSSPLPSDFSTVLEEIQKREDRL
ncbi:MAG: RluA family pseudouridine synthase [Calditrichaeota bacterium]|nr:MAG: RluA family pseudouridine synthase [Calditrichota bacterium]